MKEFQPFPKIARLSRNIVVTEKIDGTNAQIFIEHAEITTKEGSIASNGSLIMWAGSRTKWIEPGKNDNFGFAGWAVENAEELFKLGVGQHFGEWWGAGIQRRYGLDHKRFSLFNTARWSDDEVRPKCCHVVPVIYEGPLIGNGHWSTNPDPVFMPEDAVNFLSWNGSLAAPGFMDPEGIVIWHEAARQLFKKTIKGDDKPKGSTE